MSVICASFVVAPLAHIIEYFFFLFFLSHFAPLDYVFHPLNPLDREASIPPLSLCYMTSADAVYLTFMRLNFELI